MNTTLINVLLEMAKVSGTYRDYAEKTVKEVLKELEKGETYWVADLGDPLIETYYTVVQNHTMDEEAKAISRIIKDFDEIAKDGFKVDDEHLLIYRLYELSCDGNIDIKNISADDLKKVAKSANLIGKAGTVAEVADAVITVSKVRSLYKEGKVTEADKIIRDYLWTNATGWVVSEAVMSVLAISNPIVAIALIVVAGAIGSWAGKNISDLLDTIFNLYDEAGAYTYPVDPLIFDLNGDGVKTVALADGVHFDFDKNGFAEKIGWVSAEDGLLVRDLDKNGKIDSGRELMGDLTELSDEMTASNGFEALAYFDANADGVIDAKDDIYNELQIWQDKNQNGVVDDGELMSLSEAGIASINLTYENIDVTDESGNGHSQRGTYTKTDGTTSTVEDVWFEKDAANTVVSDTIDKNVLEETDEIAGLPDIQGKGNQYSLHQAGVYLEEVAEMLVA